MPKPVSHLKALDYSIVQQCIHCGLCLPTCPTYDATKLERNSPRGRIALMRAITDDRLEPTRTFAEEMYFCLGCLACMTACPAGVNYAELFERARAEAEASGVLASPRRSAIRAFTLGWLFTDLNRLKLLGNLLRLWQELGLQAAVRSSGLLRILPARLAELEAMTPEVQPAFSEDMISPVTPPVGQRRYRVAVLTGCAQDLLFSDVNRDTVEVRSSPHRINTAAVLYTLTMANGPWPKNWPVEILISFRRHNSMPSLPMRADVDLI